MCLETRKKRAVIWGMRLKMSELHGHYDLPVNSDHLTLDHWGTSNTLNC